MCVNAVVMSCTLISASTQNRQGSWSMSLVSLALSRKKTRRRNFFRRNWDKAWLYPAVRMHRKEEEHTYSVCACLMYVTVLVCVCMSLEIQNSSSYLQWLLGHASSDLNVFTHLWHAHQAWTGVNTELLCPH